MPQKQGSGRFIGERLWEQVRVLRKNRVITKGGGGDGGIRTLDTPIEVWFLSRELVSATHPRLRTRRQDARYNEGGRALQEALSREIARLAVAPLKRAVARRSFASAQNGFVLPPIHCCFSRKGFF